MIIVTQLLSNYVFFVTRKIVKVFQSFVLATFMVLILHSFSLVFVYFDSENNVHTYLGITTITLQIINTFANNELPFFKSKK